MPTTVDITIIQGAIEHLGTIGVLIIQVLLLVNGKIHTDVDYQRLKQEHEQMRKDRDAAYQARDRAIDMAMFGSRLTKDSVDLAHTVIRSGGAIDAPADHNPIGTLRSVPQRDSNEDTE